MTSWVLYSGHDNSGSSSYYYTLSAGNGLTYDGLVRYAYLDDTPPLQIWFESADGSKSPGDQVLTGDSIVIKAQVPDVDRYLKVGTYATSLRWELVDASDHQSWQIAFHGNPSTGLAIEVGSSFLIQSGDPITLYEAGSQYIAVATPGQDPLLWTIQSAS